MMTGTLYPKRSRRTVRRSYRARFTLVKPARCAPGRSSHLDGFA